MNTKTIVLAGGCFWCVEHDLKQAEGVVQVLSGYTGDTKDNADYESVSLHKTKHREAVQVTYNSEITTYRALVQFFLDHIDPTNDTGQFADKGYQYEPVIYYKDSIEKETAESTLEELSLSGLYDKKIVVKIEEEQPFFSAEEYHQNYSEKNAFQYGMYRSGSGREDFVSNTCTIRDQKNIQWKQPK